VGIVKRWFKKEEDKDNVPMNPKYKYKNKKGKELSKQEKEELLLKMAIDLGYVMPDE
jgi:hypothetical protein